MTGAKNSGGEPATGSSSSSTTTTTTTTASAQSEASNPSSKPSSTRNASPTSPPAQHDAHASSAMPRPQPFQQSADGSSKLAHPAAEDAGENSAAPSPLPPSSYGTRSRNRPGRSRPNYAEDTEMDFEMAAASTNGSLSDPSSHNSLGPDSSSKSSHAPPAGARKGSSSGQVNGLWGHAPTLPKDCPAQLAASKASPSSITPQPTTKRRKNAASVAAAAAAAAVASQPGTALTGKRASQAVTSISGRQSNMMTFDRSAALLRHGRLEADDGRTIAVNDHVYLVCEPPGEPYYLCRVMEFIHVDNRPTNRVESLRVNWFYRPRDVQRYNNDTRLVYATMHSDLCPITSLRGKCRILHRSEFDDLDDYRKSKDSFWFNQVFDRFIHRWYDVIPTSMVINVPDKVKKALDGRWKYICLETSRVKELTSAVKSCKRCVGYCAVTDSVECAVCHSTYHMNCVRPPLLKKPSRGFAWACAPCSRAQEKKLEARRTPAVGVEEGEEEEVVDEEEEEEASGETNETTPDPDAPLDPHPGTQAEIALAKMWPMRYLGIHCRVEDALQYDDRAIYPRASSRLGPRHQANVNVWHGQPIEFVKPAEIKKRYNKTASHKREGKPSKEAVAAMEADKAEKAKRPKWVMDEPSGYVRRGEDLPNKDSKCSAELMFKMPPLGVHASRGGEDAPVVTTEQVQAYMERAKALAKPCIGVEPHNTNFLDKCLALFTKHQYDAEAALKSVRKLDKRKDLKEPELTKEEEKKWNDGVAKYGSEIRSVRQHTSKNMFYGDAVRYYYMWKKTSKGREIWGSYSNRKGRSKKVEVDAQTRLVDDVADNHDDSAFDSEKAVQRKRHFQCKFCNVRHSRQWRRAPGAAPGQTVPPDGRSKDKTGHLVALCLRCANLWRRYAVKWENVDEIAKKVAQGGGKAWKRRIDEELLREVYAVQSDPSSVNGSPERGDVPTIVHVMEPPKKKQKTAAAAAATTATATATTTAAAASAAAAAAVAASAITTGTTTAAASAVGHDGGLPPAVSEVASKKKDKDKAAQIPKAPTPPPVPAQPRRRALPCAVCRSTEGSPLECAACRLTVHKSCYGVEEARKAKKWYCDTCKNDRKGSISYTYECVLCPQRDTEQDWYEQPKVTHKKKTDRDREKERLEKELIDKAKADYRSKQQEKGRPLVPREPLKRTADHNWVHVYCALWHSEIKFSNATRLDTVEGIGAPTLRYDAVCKLCKTTKGACVSCLHCHATFHVGCAHGHGYIFGFDMTPVKASRRDAVPTVTMNGETGTLLAAIWCKDHAPKSGLHSMEEVLEGTTQIALQLFAREFKQADLMLTGTARKATLVDQSTRAIPPTTTTQVNRRASGVPALTPTSAKGRSSIGGLPTKDDWSESLAVRPDRKCMRCYVDASPRWWMVDGTGLNEQTFRTANGPSSARSFVPNGVIKKEPTMGNGRRVNDSVHHIRPSILHAVSGALEGHLRLSTDVDVHRSASYLCQKCHWKVQNGEEGEEEEAGKREGEEGREREGERRPRSPLAYADPQLLPLRSPQPSSYSALPPPISSGSWSALSGPPPPPPSQPPSLPSWHNSTLPGPSQHHLHGANGYPGPSTLQPQPLAHVSPFHAPYSQPNGYPSYSTPPMHTPMPPLCAPYSSVPVNGHVPPLHHGNGSMLVNGLPPSHSSPYSSRLPRAHHASRSIESPYSAPIVAASSYAPIRHTGSATGRPTTPRDIVMRDTPFTAPAPADRASSGASANPSLRNLLH